MKTYKVGEYLIHERSGVCQVAEIVEKALQGKGTEKLYYSLQPIYENSSHILTPVDSKVRIRNVKSKLEMEQLLEQLPDLEFIDESNPRVIAEKFKEKIAQFDPYILATVVKSIYLRKQMRMAAGKKAMSSDEKIMQNAGKRLFEEMAFAMDSDVETIEKRFYKRLTEEKDKCIKGLGLGE